MGIFKQGINTDYICIGIVGPTKGLGRSKTLFLGNWQVTIFTEWFTPTSWAILFCYNKKGFEKIPLKIIHGVWKSQKKSHSTRAKRATFTFWVDKSSLKEAKNGPIWRVFENLMLAVKQSYQTGQFKIGQKLVENAKIEKFKCDILGYFQTLCCGAFLSYL